MLWGYLAVGACWPVSVYAVAIGAVARGDLHILPGGDLQAVDDPAGISAWLGSAEAVILPVPAVFWLVFVARQVLSWRRADGERRQQLKWLMSGAAVCMAATTVIAVRATLDTSASPAAQAVFNGATIGIVALPVSVGVAILKYRRHCSIRCGGGCSGNPPTYRCGSANALIDWKHLERRVSGCDGPDLVIA